MAGDVLWLGRVLGDDGEIHHLRVRTEGRAPTADDVVEEISDPFALAQVHGELDVFTQAGTAAPLAVHTGVPGRLLAPVLPRKIVCVGRNYVAHARELGHEVPSEPLLFFKPSSALVGHGEPVRLPGGFERIDMEAELVVVIGKRGRSLPKERALEHVLGYTLGNDVSNRDLQQREKLWTRAKGWDTFAPAGPWIRVVPPGEPLPQGVRIQGFIDDRRVQDAPIGDMVFDVATIVAYLSEAMTIEPGDLVYTGTPDGVSPLVPGNVARVELAGLALASLQNPVVAAD